MNSIFLKPADKRLKSISQIMPQNQIYSKTTQKIIKTLLRVAYGEQKDAKKPIMVGLAAPQIGIFKRIILVDVKADGKDPLRSRFNLLRKASEASKVGDLRIYINPEIIWKSKKEEEWYEGCYSTGKVCGIVARPVSIKIKASKLHSRSGHLKPLREWEFVQVKEKHTGYVARIFQHEIDHLDGKLFIEHIKDPDKLHCVEKDEFPLYRNKQAWRNWPKKYSIPKDKSLAFVIQKKV